MKTKLTLLTMFAICLLAGACAAVQQGQASGMESAASAAFVREDLQPIRDAQTPHAQVIDRTSAEFDGITLTYDSSLLGNVSFQEIAATPNQGLFEQPSPAHTWIGFGSEGMNSDPSSHWSLQREPQIIIYSLYGFGSFAPLDVRARAQIDSFKQLLAKRPSKILDQIPVIVPTNSGQIIRAQIKWLDFANGAGVRFLSQYDQAVTPINNEGLVYIFQGLTTDGLHGITAVFPISAVGLRDGPAMKEEDYVAFIDNFDTEMAEVIEQLNATPDSNFSPALSQLDAMLQSINVAPTETDLVLTDTEPQQLQTAKDTEVFASAQGSEVLFSLSAGKAVVVNAADPSGDRSRILCPDGSTANCWIDNDAILGGATAAEPVFYTRSGTEAVGAVVEITAISANDIYDGPGTGYRLVGELQPGESVSVFGPDESDRWLAIACPRSIGQACWVVGDTAINEPTGFFLGDGWQDVTSDYVAFRAPGDWQPEPVKPGMGSVLAEWRLGIPGVEGDQTLAFFAPPFDKLQPPDIIEQYDFEIGGQSGEKWIRSSADYISYDYYSAGSAAALAQGAGSFGIHVTLPAANPDLESTLDMLAASVRFLTPAGADS